jgi:hypothetical protein
MAQPIQQRLFTPPPPLEATVATRRKLFKKQQEAGRDNAAASGYSSVLVGPRARATKEEEGQGPPAEPEAAEIAAGPEEGQGRASEPGAAAAGSVSPPGSSIHGQYWKVISDELS